MANFYNVLHPRGLLLYFNWNCQFFPSFSSNAQWTLPSASASSTIASIVFSLPGKPVPAWLHFCPLGGQLASLSTCLPILNSISLNRLTARLLSPRTQVSIVTGFVLLSLDSSELHHIITSRLPFFYPGRHCSVLPNSQTASYLQPMVFFRLGWWQAKKREKEWTWKEGNVLLSMGVFIMAVSSSTVSGVCVSS